MIYKTLAMKTFKFIITAIMATAMLCACQPYRFKTDNLRAGFTFYGSESENDSSSCTIQLCTRLFTGEPSKSFPDYAFMYMFENKTREVLLDTIPYNTYAIEHYTVVHKAQVFRCSWDEHERTITLEYVDPDYLPDILNDPDKYIFLLPMDYENTFDLYGNHFIEEGELALKSIDVPAGGDSRTSYYSVEIDGIEYIFHS